MFKKEKGECGEKERKRAERIKRQGQPGETEMLAAGSLEGFIYLFLFFLEGEGSRL